MWKTERLSVSVTTIIVPQTLKQRLPTTTHTHTHTHPTAASWSAEEDDCILAGWLSGVKQGVPGVKRDVAKSIRAR